MLLPEIRLAGTGDVHEMAGIERRCFPAPWSESQLEMCVRPGERIRSWLAMAGGEIAGYVCALHKSQDLLHIANLAVIPERRRAGLGSLLIGIAEEWGVRMGARASILEVRKENEPARRLYDRLGYWMHTILSDFYGTGEDGLRLVRELREDRTSSDLISALSRALGPVPGTGVILGSGLSWVADIFGRGPVVSVASLPGQETDCLPGHPGSVCVSGCGRFVFLLGRRHRYQGYGADRITEIPGALSDLGATTWILTTSSGALDTSFRVGDSMIFTDHVNLSGSVPGTPPGITGEGVYSPILMQAATEAAGPLLGDSVRTGVFACVSGPVYETPAEISLLQSRGVGAVSMSTAQEALLLSGRGCRVMGLSLITNTAESEAGVTHDEVLAAQGIVRTKQEDFLQRLLEKVAGNGLH